MTLTVPPFFIYALLLPKGMLFPAYFGPTAKFHKLVSLLTICCVYHCQVSLPDILFKSCGPFLKNSKCLSPSKTQTPKSSFWGSFNLSPSLLSFQAHIWTFPFENNLLLIWIQAEHNFPDDSQRICNVSALSALLRMLPPEAIPLLKKPLLTPEHCPTQFFQSFFFHLLQICSSVDFS